MLLDVECAVIVLRMLLDNLALLLDDYLGVFAVHRRLVEKLVLVLDRLHLVGPRALIVILEQLDE